jgi:hypothetical protein
MPAISFTPKEIHALVQMLRQMIDDDTAFEYARKQELEQIKTKLQNVKDG